MAMLPERLRALRKERGFTQERLASLLGLNRVTIVGYESGNREPDLEVLTGLVAILHTSADFLLGLTDERQSLQGANPPACREIQPAERRDLVLRLCQTAHRIASLADLEMLAGLAERLAEKTDEAVAARLDTKRKGKNSAERKKKTDGRPPLPRKKT